MQELFPSRATGRFGRRQKRERGARIPVTVVTGFLGAGKTTLVKHFLETPEGHGTAVVVNEFGEAGIDDALLRDSHREDRAARQRLPVLQFPLRPAGDAAPPGCRPRARRHSALRPHRHRDQRARRPEPDPHHLRHRPRARRRVLRRGGDHRHRGRAGHRDDRGISPKRVGSSSWPTASSCRRPTSPTRRRLTL